MKVKAKDPSGISEVQKNLAKANFRMKSSERVRKLEKNSERERRVKNLKVRYLKVKKAKRVKSHLLMVNQLIRNQKNMKNYHLWSMCILLIPSVT